MVKNNFPDPTLSTLAGRNSIKTADLMAKQPEELDLHVIEAFNESMNLRLHGHPHTVNAFPQLDDPPEGWRRCGLIDLVWHGLLVRGQLRSKAALRHGVEQ
jgi:hypothetical protein